MNYWLNVGRCNVGKGVVFRKEVGSPKMGVLKLPVIPSYQNWHLQKGKKHQVSRNGRNEFATVAT